MVLFDKIKAFRWVWMSMLIMMLAVGCVKDISVDGSSESFRFTVNTKALNGTTIGGASLSCVRLVAVRSADSGIAFNKSTANGLQEIVRPDGSSTFTLELKEGDYTLFAIANETADMTRELNKLVDLNDLKNIVVAGSFDESSIPFLGQGDFILRKATGGKDANFEVSTDGGNSWKSSLELTLERTQCKVSLYLRKKTASADVVKIRKVELCKIPDKSYLLAKAYEAAEPQTRTVFENTTGLSIGDDVTGGNDDLTTYTTIFDAGEIFPEKLMIDKADASKATYLRIIAEYGTAQTSYIVKLRNDLFIEDYNLTRNVHYNVYGTISSTGDMGIYAVIVPTKIHDISVSWKPVEGLVIVSDREADLTANRNVWNDYAVYSGILKVYNKNVYNNILFKYGSVVAIKNDTETSLSMPFAAPVSVSDPKDVIWFPGGYDILGITNWENVPYFDNNADFSAGNTPEAIAQGKGDPCRLAGLTPQQIETDKIIDNKQWHMATPAEYALLMKAANGAGYENDLGYRSFHELLLPNVKYRDTGGVLQASHEGGGNYWTTAGMGAFSFKSQNPTGANLAQADPGHGFTVRCVRNTIPKADLTFGSIPTFTYQGSTNGIPLNVYSNMPYWKLELITSGDGVGTSAEFNDFSFVPPSDSRYPLHMVEGNYTGSPYVYMKRKESTSDRTFGVKFTSIHFNGEELEHKLKVTQFRYSLKAEMTPTPHFDNNENKIPVGGGRYTMHITLSPADISMPAEGSIKIELGYHGTLKATSSEATLNGGYEYDVILEIPKNETPDIIGLDFVCRIKEGAAANFRTIGESRYYQLP